MAQIFLGRIKYLKTEGDLSSYISLKAYAGKHHYTAKYCYELIKQGRLKAYRFKRRWWILDQPPTKSDQFAFQ
jgi:hypothetical protein